MRADPIHALLLPFERGDLSLGSSERVLFLRAEPHPSLLGDGLDWRAHLLAVQSSKPVHDALVAAGFETRPDLPGAGFSRAFVRLTRHKAESLGLIAEALERLSPGGLLHVAGAREEGIESIAKLMKQALGPLEVESKHHARVVMLRRGEADLSQPVMAWRSALRPAEHVPGFLSAPGLFSYDRIDRGSCLLTAHMPAVMAGRVADLGCGWGYLGSEILSRNGVTGLDLYEAEKTALDCASVNLARRAAQAGVRIEACWSDVAAGAIGSGYDWIVTNPPFHAAGVQQTSLGQRFIEVASQALKPGGRLLLVANQLLPYEAVVARRFAEQTLLAREDGFKVIEARR